MSTYSLVVVTACSVLLIKGVNVFTTQCLPGEQQAAVIHNWA